jgi:hypothetical protein
MKTLKHIGKMKNTGEKVLVIFRTLPGESNMALVLATSTLPDIYHDALIQLVETDQAQDANEFGEIMFIRRFPDGRLMLSAMQQDTRLKKVATDTVIITPTLSASIPLDQLNVIIAEQRGVAVGDLASLVNGGTPADRDSVKTPPVVESEKVEEVKTSEVLTDKDLARSYRSQADAMYKEAAKLRKQADDLDPPAKKAAAKSKETESAESAV